MLACMLPFNEYRPLFFALVNLRMYTFRHALKRAWWYIYFSVTITVISMYVSTCLRTASARSLCLSPSLYPLPPLELHAAGQFTVDKCG